MTTRSPLTWPANVPRTSSGNRRVARFGKKDASGILREITIAEALARLDAEIDLLGCQRPILSSNLELTLSGAPRSGQKEPSDPGVALYFNRHGKDIVLPCDRFVRAADNIAGIAGHIKALRDIERYGVATTQQMFTGFEALPAPGKRKWWEIMGFSHPGQSEIEISTRYRTRARECAGSEAALKELNVARDEGMKELGYR